jgi:sugar lactone lactonase YvrE
MKNSLAICALFLFHFCNGQTYSIETVAGNGTGGYSSDGGMADTTELNNPWGVAVDKFGNVYIADYSNNRIRKINTAGIISTVAGNGNAGYSADGGMADTTELNNPTGVAVDSSGNVYIADLNNHRIRKINTGGIISTIAGTGTAGFSGDGGQATFAKFNYPGGVTVDKRGNIYVCDLQNKRIRKINASGVISTIAGNGTAGYNGDGIQATSASLQYPQQVAVDDTGNVYIADEFNQRIRKVDTNGIITTVAGTGTSGYSGDGGQATSAKLNYPYGVAVDKYGSLYIADNYNQVIRKVNAGGIISRIAGNAVGGYSGDGGPALAAQINSPHGIAVDILGNVYIGDYYNNRVRKLTAQTTGIKEIYYPLSTAIFPNPNDGEFTLEADGIKEEMLIEVYNLYGDKIVGIPAYSKANKINLTDKASGLYLYRIVSEKGILISQGKFIIKK